MNVSKSFKPTKKNDTFWDAVGIPARGESLFIVLREGLPFNVYSRLSLFSGIDKKSIALAIHIPKTTLQSRAKAGRFNMIESDNIFRFAEVLNAAIELFEGDRVKASLWLKSNVRGLGNKKPLDMLGTSAESQAVLSLIERLENGVFV